MLGTGFRKYDGIREPRHPFPLRCAPCDYQQGMSRSHALWERRSASLDASPYFRKSVLGHESARLGRLVKWIRVALLGWFCLTALACGSMHRARPDGSARGGSASGLASWYGADFQGRKTASGEAFNRRELTAAHRSWPFGTVVQVIHRETGRSVVVRINDRGPFVPNRIIDLSEAAARQIGVAGEGVVPVELRVLRWPRKNRLKT